MQEAVIFFLKETFKDIMAYSHNELKRIFHPKLEYLKKRGARWSKLEYLHKQEKEGQEN